MSRSTPVVSPTTSNVTRLPSDRATSPDVPLTAEGRALHDRFVAAIDDDLDMPVALALLREILRVPISDDERRWLILDADRLLGLDLDRVELLGRRGSRTWSGLSCRHGGIIHQ